MAGTPDGKAQVRQFLRQGLAGAPIQQSGMRPASLEFLRSGGAASSALPVTVMVYPDGRARINDGRHRITVAREQGVRKLNATVKVMGPRGGVRATYQGPIKI